MFPFKKGISHTSAIIIACIVVGVICYLAVRLGLVSECFGLNPNVIYTRGEGITPDTGALEFSMKYRAQLAPGDTTQCKTAHTPDDICSIIRGSPQAQIPPEEIALCAGTPAPTALSGDISDLVYKYAILTSQRDPQMPWKFNPYGSPSIPI